MRISDPTMMARIFRMRFMICTSCQSGKRGLLKEIFGCGKFITAGPATILGMARFRSLPPSGLLPRSLVSARCRVQLLLRLDFPPHAEPALVRARSEHRGAGSILTAASTSASAAHISVPADQSSRPIREFHQPRVAPQGFTVAFLRIRVVLHQPVHVAQFVVVEGEVGLD